MKGGVEMAKELPFTSVGIMLSGYLGNMTYVDRNEDWLKAVAEYRDVIARYHDEHREERQAEYDARRV